MKRMISNRILDKPTGLYNLFPGSGGKPTIPCDKCGGYLFSDNTIMVNNGVKLSPSEYEVFKRVNLADKVIAYQLFISVETVRKHFQNIRRKTGLNTKIELAIWATQKGIYNGYSN